MLQIQNKLTFENNCWVGIVDASTFNTSEENRIKAVTDIASITRGKLGMGIPECDKCKGTNFNEMSGECTCGRSIELGNIHPRRFFLYHRLLTESAGKPSTPFEFVPTLSRGFRAKDMNTWDYRIIPYFKYVSFDSKGLYTNFRNDYVFVPDNVIMQGYNTPEEVKDFKIIVGRVPKQVYDHIVMHRSFSRISESSRNKRYLKEVEFWVDSKQSLELQEMEKYDNEQSVKRAFKYIEKGMKPEQATKRLSCTRLITFALGAWLQDKNSWQNLFNVRAEHSGTQEITKQVINNIKSLIFC